MNAQKLYNTLDLLIQKTEREIRTTLRGKATVRCSFICAFTFAADKSLPKDSTAVQELKITLRRLRRSMKELLIQSQHEILDTPSMRQTMNSGRGRSDHQQPPASRAHHGSEKTLRVRALEEIEKQLLERLHNSTDATEISNVEHDLHKYVPHHSVALPAVLHACDPQN